MQHIDKKNVLLAVAEAEFVDRTVSARTLLGEIHFGASPLLPEGQPHPVAWVGMPSLIPGAHIEMWTSPQPAVYQRSGPLMFARNRDLLFGCFAAESPAEFVAFEARVQEAYARLLTLIDVEGYPHLLRIWNYFPRLHEREGELDRYMVFSRGRHRAIEAHYGGRFTGRLPAASAVGSRHGDLVIYFLAGREPGRHRENPRQMSAYSYPSRYGPKSPSFARATLHRQPDVDMLYISGTASIVGHESLHSDDLAAQLEETLTNIRILIESTADEERAKFRGMESIACVKVYVRRREDLASIRSRLQAMLRPDTPCLFVEADICRPELLLEIEAIARAARG